MMAKGTTEERAEAFRLAKEILSNQTALEGVFDIDKKYELSRCVFCRVARWCTETDDQHVHTGRVFWISWRWFGTCSEASAVTACVCRMPSLVFLHGTLRLKEHKIEWHFMSHGTGFLWQRKIERHLCCMDAQSNAQSNRTWCHMDDWSNARSQILSDPEASSTALKLLLRHLRADACIDSICELIPEKVYSGVLIANVWPQHPRADPQQGSYSKGHWKRIRSQHSLRPGWVREKSSWVDTNTSSALLPIPSPPFSFLPRICLVFDI